MKFRWYWLKFIVATARFYQFFEDNGRKKPLSEKITSGIDSAGQKTPINMYSMSIVKILIFGHFRDSEKRARPKNHGSHAPNP